MAELRRPSRLNSCSAHRRCERRGLIAAMTGHRKTTAGRLAQPQTPELRHLLAEGS
ncbi:hypothetical protein [Bradyrhizobium sp. JR3.5]